MEPENLIIKLHGAITTDYYGFQQLIDVYQQLKSTKKGTVTLDFSDLIWFDGNMSAYFAAIIYKLQTDNDIKFVAVAEDLEQKFDVLFRNGFFKLKDAPERKDERKSTVQLVQFYTNQKDEFCRYIEEDLMKHRGMHKKLPEGLKEKITGDLIEVLGNIEYHSKVDDPFFMCGQYYPKNNEFILTITDLGVGFLPAINIKTKNQIKTDIDAIRWALAGNTTKTDCPGGLFLRNVSEFFKKGGGNMQIISGRAYFSLDLMNSISKGYRDLVTPFMGATINLCFNVK